MTIEHVEALAHDRRLVTGELQATNAFYGHDAVLKRYAGLPERARLKVAIEHGIAVVDQIWDIDLATPMPVFLCAARERAERYEELATGGRIAVPIGPMIRYVGGDPRPPSGPRRLLVFPAHSTHHIDAVYDVDAFAAMLAPYREAWEEVRVCVYWKDVLSGVARAYERHGLECVTAGHIYDPEFLPRLRHILDGAHAVVSNEVGSHMLYAVLLERPAWIHTQDIDYTAESEEVLVRDGASEEHWQGRTMVRLRELFADQRHQVTDEQRAFIHELAGVDELRSPAELRAILEDAEERYRRTRPLLGRGGRTAYARLRHVKDRLAAAYESR